MYKKFVGMVFVGCWGMFIVPYEVHQDMVIRAYVG